MYHANWKYKKKLVDHCNYKKSFEKIITRFPCVFSALQRQILYSKLLNRTRANFRAKFLFRAAEYVTTRH